MTAQDFLAYFYIPHIGIYSISLLLSLCIFFLFLGRIVRSIIDPLLLSILGIGFSSAIPVFLLLEKEIKQDIFLYFIINQFIIVFVFYLLNKKKNTVVIVRDSSLDKVCERFFYFAFLLYIISTIYAWILNGIPIFNSNRFEINIDNSSGILGLLNRLSSAMSLYVIIYVYYIFFHGDKKKAIIIYGILLILLLFSGSKGFILLFIKAFYFYSVFYEGRIPKVKAKYIPFIVISPIIVILLAGYTNDTTSAWTFFGYRLLANGDTYWNAYPNNVINDIKIDSPIANMTFILWGPFRHILGIDVNNSNIQTVGALLFQENYGFYPDAGAPNSQLAILSYAYYRWYGIILTFIISLFCALLYRHLYTAKSKRNIYECCKKGLIISTTLGLFGDTYLLFGSIFQIFIYYLLFFGFKLLYRNYK